MVYFDICLFDIQDEKGAEGVSCVVVLADVGFRRGRGERYQIAV